MTFRIYIYIYRSSFKKVTEGDFNEPERNDKIATQAKEASSINVFQHAAPVGPVFS